MNGDSFDEEYVDAHGECAEEISRLKKQRDEALSALQALADGRTACVEVRSEAQAREAFEKWYVAGPRDSWPTADGIWFAALRYAGALKS